MDHPARAERLSRLTAAELAARRAALGDRLQLLDVRPPSEVAVAPVAGARNVPLADLRRALDDLDREAPVVAVCAGGARSAVAAGLLRRVGVRRRVRRAGAAACGRRPVSVSVGVVVRRSMHQAPIGTASPIGARHHPRPASRRSER